MFWLVFIIVCIIAATLFTIITAPVGYQDDDGFHYGKPNEYDKDFF